MSRLIKFLTLFGSLSTLLCCALPVTLVSIGMGASFASLTSTFPGVLWLASHKNILFLVTAILIGLSFFLMKRAEQYACPIEVEQREVCQVSKGASRYILYFSLLLYVIGLLFSFVIPRIIYDL